MPRRWHQLGDEARASRRGRWQTSPVTEESSKETVKTIARGMPDVSGVTVVTNARVFYHHARLRALPGARHSLRPLIAEGIHPRLGRVSCGERVDACLNWRRHCEEQSDEAIQ